MSELLCPVGNMEMALAAIHNGADAIYVGFPYFNARGRSHDFEIEELREIIQTCHLYGVRTHLALNILIFPQEVKAVIAGLAKVLPLKPDALIIQDLGLAKLVRQMAPDQVIHASTQMTVTNHEAIHLVEDLNIRRFVLGRENSISEIKLIQQATGKDLEIFVHGALCVSYSGQCFTSESIGGRSANRGQCAQSCRFGYEVHVDGERKDLVDKKYVVSPNDLCGIAEIPELIKNGVSSFKIEGRLKSPEYVAAATQEYRKAIDSHHNSQPRTEAELEFSKRKLSTTYSRGFFSGWLHGVNHQKLVEGTAKSHRGIEIGRVVGVDKNTMTAELKEVSNISSGLSSGDGLLWVSKDWIEDGAQIYSVQKVQGKKVLIEFSNDILLSGDKIGARLFLNSQVSQKKELRKSFQDHNVFKRIEVSIKVEATVGSPLKVEMSDGRYICRSHGKTLVELAKNRAVDNAFFQDELGALGGTPFVLKSFEVNRAQDQNIFYSHRELKEIRRDLSNQLEKQRREKRVWGDETTLAGESEMQDWSDRLKHRSSAGDFPSAKLNILLREKAQVEDLIGAIQQGKITKSEIDCVILDFEFGRDYEASIFSLKAEQIRNGIATTRILKPKEYMHFVRIERLNPDVILIRNLGALHYFRVTKPFAGELRGDFSLNVTNHLTADYLLNKGLKSVTASYDLNAEQVSDLLRSSDATRIEVTIHQHMPAFHMEHCVFASLLSQGSSFRDCGKPCEKHRVQLVDEFGNRHQIKADPECRNTMYNATAQSAARHFAAWKALHLGSVRYEALYERGQELIGKIAGYQKLLSLQKSASDLVLELKLTETYGLGEGPIGKANEYRSIKKKEAARPSL